MRGRRASCVLEGMPIEEFPALRTAAMTIPTLRKGSDPRQKRVGAG